MAKVTVLPEDANLQLGNWINIPENGGFWDERDWLWRAPVDWEAGVDEDLAIGDIFDHLLLRTLYDSFELASGEIKEVSCSISEKLVLSEINKRVLKWIRRYDEKFKVKDTNVPKDIHSWKNVDLRFYDVIKETVRGVLSDLLFQEGVWDLNSIDKFVRNGGRHVGYTTFREFITGDYEYQKALFRLAMESKTADRALIEEIDIAIDVDDVYDRGTTTVTDKNYGANVIFNRVFAIAPEVTITMRTGNALNAIRPEIISVQTTGFTVRLYDVEGNLTTGTFTWIAAGY